ncbi:hypothetical protein NHX12_010535 [Muraenolepis orangiensis]|uniref:Sushi domain-containing protein n=1 Tax=Muraenolepis orangiensis TaxID=630683 RepID=A0A9Q0I7D4_9TELE|nr:hypothetical protein NHX12_010535 [Muraenolepis orangiensis]
MCLRRIKRSVTAAAAEAFPILQSKHESTAVVLGGGRRDGPSCALPRSPAGGDVSVSRLQAGGEAFFMCSSGYRLLGPQVLTCRNATTPYWSGREPTCIGKRQDTLLVENLPNEGVMSTGRHLFVEFTSDGTLTSTGAAIRYEGRGHVNTGTGEVMWRALLHPTCSTSELL